MSNRRDRGFLLAALIGVAAAMGCGRAVTPAAPRARAAAVAPVAEPWTLPRVLATRSMQAPTIGALDLPRMGRSRLVQANGWDELGRQLVQLDCPDGGRLGVLAGAFRHTGMTGPGFSMEVVLWFLDTDTDALRRCQQAMAVKQGAPPPVIDGDIMTGGLPAAPFASYAALRLDATTMMYVIRLFRDRPTPAELRALTEAAPGAAAASPLREWAATSGASVWFVVDDPALVQAMNVPGAPVAVAATVDLTARIAASARARFADVAAADALAEQANVAIAALIDAGFLEDARVEPRGDEVAVSGVLGDDAAQRLAADFTAQMRGMLATPPPQPAGGRVDSPGHVE